MAGVKMTKVRGFIASLFALVLVDLLAAVLLRMAGVEIPGFSNIADAIGM